MPRVLLTRPRQDSERLAARLAQAGYDVMIEPLLMLRATAEPPPDFAHLQAVMLTSSHALDFVARPQSGITGLPCFAVGGRTASAAKAFGFQDVHDAAGDGLALAKQMAATLDPEKAAVLHIAGRDIDSEGREELQRRGFTVRTWTSYAADAATELSPETIHALRSSAIDAVLLFSARTATTFATLIKHNRLEACCGGVIALGISTAVCAASGGLPWRRIEAAVLPSEDSLLQRLQELLPATEVS